MAEEQKTSSGEQKLMAVLCYLGILVLIPLVLKKSDPEVKFHIEQGLALFVSWVIWWFVRWILYKLVIGLVLFPILWLVDLGFLVLVIIGILNAIRGEKKPLPLLGGFAKYFRL